jgi:hypothetical protein
MAGFGATESLNFAVALLALAGASLVYAGSHLQHVVQDRAQSATTP